MRRLSPSLTPAIAALPLPKHPSQQSARLPTKTVRVGNGDRWPTRISRGGSMPGLKKWLRLASDRLPASMETGHSIRNRRSDTKRCRPEGAATRADGAPRRIPALRRRLVFETMRSSAGRWLGIETATKTSSAAEAAAAAAATAMPPRCLQEPACNLGSLAADTQQLIGMSMCKEFGPPSLETKPAGRRDGGLSRLQFLRHQDLLQQ